MALKTYRIICTPLAYIFVLSFLSCIKSDMPVLNEELSLFAFIISDNNLDSHTDYIEKDLVQGLKDVPLELNYSFTLTVEQKHLFYSICFYLNPAK